ncbi:MAG TPA: error-prone DNA polymerase [Tepidisphaeraceae bacterium]|nr:error-prone DNA polymerase [Tepidisphaeraceae bacterium]
MSDLSRPPAMSPPDIDVDFEHERREEVLQYIYEKYGRERAGMTAEVISYRGRSAVRDVGKALGLSLDLVDQMAKKLDWWQRGSLSETQLRELGLDPKDPTIRRVVDLVAQLLGFPRHLSQHVGGMVMTRGPLCELVPIENASMDNRTVIEWDKDDIDAMGILKVDVLALGMLTCISKAFRLINERALATDEHRCTQMRKNLASSVSICAPSVANQNSSAVSSVVDLLPSRLELHTVPAEDPAVYEMIGKADTVGVFQVESRAQMSMLPRLRPRCFYDLVIEVAIVRPGPIQGNMVHPYLRRRNGEEPISYPNEALREVLGKTLGVPLFQEQAMRVAMVGAGFTAEEADRLRRAMAAWRKHGAIDVFHQKIIDGMLKNGYTREFAEQCFLQIRGFGEYGFPESHAASFALLVYVSAWIKRYHPAAFCAALLNSQPMGFYAPAQIARDAKEHGVDVRPVDVNHGEWDCTLEDKNDEGRTMNDEQKENGCSSFIVPRSSFPTTSWGLAGPAVRLGFRMVKGLAMAHARQLVAARHRFGAFTSIAQFHRATALRRQVLERLAEADAFSSLGLSRREALWQVMELNDDDAPLFDHLDSSAPSSLRRSVAPSLPRMPLGQEVMIDYQTAGLSLKRHPVALVRADLQALNITPAEQIRQMSQGHWVRVAGLVLIRQRPATASGIVFQTLEDETGIVNLIIRPNIYDKYRSAARVAGLLQADGYLERQGDVIHIMVWRLRDLSHLLAGHRFMSRDFH